MATAVVSGRIDAALKRKAEVIIEEAGSTPGEVIKNVWANIVATGQIPQSPEEIDEQARKAQVLDELWELVHSLPPCPNVAKMSDDDIKEMMMMRYV